MDREAPQLKRRLFGYDKQSVLQALADREAVLDWTEESIQTAKRDAAAAEAALDALREELELARTAEARATHLESEIRAAREETQAAESRAEEARAEVVAVRDELRVVTTAIQAELQATRTQLGERTGEARSQAGRIAQLETELARARTEVERAREAEAQIPGLKAELAAARRDAVAADARTTQTRAEHEAVRAELAAARQDVETAEAMTTQTRAELAAARQDLESRTEEAVEPSEAEMRRDLAENVPEEELSTLIKAAEKAIARIMKGARANMKEQHRQSERARREVEAELEEFADWGYEVDALAHSLREGVGEALIQIDQVPAHIREALSPMTGAFGRLNEQLDALTTTLGSQPLITPSDPDGSGGEADWHGPGIGPQAGAPADPPFGRQPDDR